MVTAPSVDWDYLHRVQGIGEPATLEKFFREFGVAIESAARRLGVIDREAWAALEHANPEAARFAGRIAESHVRLVLNCALEQMKAIGNLRPGGDPNAPSDWQSRPAVELAGDPAVLAAMPIVDFTGIDICIRKEFQKAMREPRLAEYRDLARLVDDSVLLARVCQMGSWGASQFGKQPSPPRPARRVKKTPGRKRDPEIATRNATIRKRAKSGESQADLAREFDLDKGQMSRIIRES